MGGEAKGARVLPAGARGGTGSALARRPHGLGAPPAVAGRGPDRMAALAHACGTCPGSVVDA